MKYMSIKTKCFEHFKKLQFIFKTLCIELYLLFKEEILIITYKKHRMAHDSRLHEV